MAFRDLQSDDFSPFPERHGGRSLQRNPASPRITQLA
jgi:hypothetical protein